jgi:hypothetical protein
MLTEPVPLALCPLRSVLSVWAMSGLKICRLFPREGRGVFSAKNKTGLAPKTAMI